MNLCGTVLRVFLPRGFAFVRGDDGHDYFLHADDFSGHWDGETIHTGARIMFEPKTHNARDKKLRAIHASLIDTKTRKGRHP